MNYISRFIAQNLNLYMLRIHDALFYIYFVITESHFRFRLGSVISFLKIFHAVYISHTAAAAAIDRFNHDGETMLFRKCLNFREITDRPFRAGNSRNIRFFRLDTGIHLIAEHNQMLYSRTDKDDSFLFTSFCQFCIFREKSVARMDGIDMMLLTNADDILNIEIGINGFVIFTHQISFIGTVAVKRQHIFLRINCYRSDSQLITCPKHTNGDFATIRYQNLINFSHGNPPHV